MRVYCPNCEKHLLSLGDTLDGLADVSKIGRVIKRAIGTITGPRFDLAAETWLRAKEHRVAPDTARTYKEFLRPLILFFGNVGLDDINIEQIRDYQGKRRETVGAERINHEIGVLKQVLGKKLWGKIAEEYERLPQTPSSVGRALSKKEHERLFAAAQSEPKWRVVYLAGIVAANTTAGRRELLSLRLKDVDLDRRMLHVNRGKTRYRLRDIPLNKAAFLGLSELIKRAKELGSVDPDHFIFPYFDRESKEYIPTKHSPSFRDQWRALTRSVGMRGLRFHDLRHSAITNLLEKGVPEAVVMEISGHIERRTLMRYSHQRVAAKKKAVNKLHRDVEKRA